MPNSGQTSILGTKNCLDTIIPSRFCDLTEYDNVQITQNYYAFIAYVQKVLKREFQYSRDNQHISWTWMTPTCDEREWQSRKDVFIET